MSQNLVKPKTVCKCRNKSIELSIVSELFLKRILQNFDVLLENFVGDLVACYFIWSQI